MENYRVGNLIGGGGMADVYHAMHVGLDRPVAMKVMKAWLAGDEEFVERFHREARICARMNHEHIVQVYDLGVEKGRPYLVMELLQGETLRQRMRKIGQVPEDEAAGIVKQVLSGLIYAHEQAGIIHRDIKPGNIFLCQTGVVKVMDFGIARAAAETRLTQTNAQLGTPEYMAPEQVKGESIDARSDLYAVGVMLYEMLTGDVPFKADTPLAVLHQQVTKQPPTLPDRFSPALRGVVNRALVKDPNGRFLSAREMLEALEKVGGGRRAGANSFAISRRALTATGSALGLAALGAAGYAALKYTPLPPGLLPTATKAAVSGGTKTAKAAKAAGTAPLPARVPDLRGLSLSRAEAALEDVGLKRGEVSREYSASVGAGEVVRQEPDGGAGLARGRAVALVVSRGTRPAPPARPRPANTPAPPVSARRATVAPKPSPAAPRRAAAAPAPGKPSGGGGQPRIDF